MMILLDTHICLGFISRTTRLGITVRDVIRNPNNEV